MISDDATAKFVHMVNKTLAEIGVSQEDAAALLFGCATDAAKRAWGAEQAAMEIYLLSLQVARAAGIGENELPSKSRH